MMGFCRCAPTPPFCSSTYTLLRFPPLSTVLASLLLLERYANQTRRDGTRGPFKPRKASPPRPSFSPVPPVNCDSGSAAPRTVSSTRTDTNEMQRVFTATAGAPNTEKGGQELCVYMSLQHQAYATFATFPPSPLLPRLPALENTTQKAPPPDE